MRESAHSFKMSSLRKVVPLSKAEAHTGICHLERASYTAAGICMLLTQTRRRCMSVPAYLTPTCADAHTLCLTPTAGRPAAQRIPRSRPACANLSNSILWSNGRSISRGTAGGWNGTHLNAHLNATVCVAGEEGFS